MLRSIFAPAEGGLRLTSAFAPLALRCGEVSEAKLAGCCAVWSEALDHCGDWETMVPVSQEHNAQEAPKGEVLRDSNAIPVHLPSLDTKRWTARRKASVVAAVLSGLVTIEEVCRRYGLSVDEFLSWHNAMQTHGVQGLRITKLQNYRYSHPKGAERTWRAVTSVNRFGGSNENASCRRRSVKSRRNAQSRS